MALFKRKNTTTTQVPAEIQQYYQAEKRERTGIAWLLAFATLIVTILLAAGIFFAGRWTYRKIAHSGENGGSSEVANNNKDEQSKSVESESNKQREEEQRAKDQVDKEKAEKQAKQRRAEEEKQKNEQAEKKREEQSQSSSSTLPSGESPTSGKQVAGENIPNTGPGDTLAVFIVVSSLFYYLHQKFYLSKKQ